MTYALPLSPGYARGLTGEPAVIVDRRTGAIVHLIQRVLNRSSM